MLFFLIALIYSSMASFHLLSWTASLKPTGSQLKNRQKSVRLFSFSVTSYNLESVLVFWGLGEEFGGGDDDAGELPRFEDDGGDGVCASNSFGAWTSSSKNMPELFHSSCDFHFYVLSSSNSTSLLTVKLVALGP